MTRHILDRTYRRVVRTARCTLGVLGSSLDPLKRKEITIGGELAVVAL